MKKLDTPMSGLILLQPKIFGDSRGFFMEAYQRERYREFGIPESFVQDSHSRSARGILRGMHYQIRRPQGKLIYVVRGEVFDVAVDLRVGSPTFGTWYGTTLSDENHWQLYVPPGFAHGFQVVSDVADVLYKCTDYYDPGSESGIPWNDPDVAIEWPDADPLLSEKDLSHPMLRQHEESTLPQVSTIA